MVKLLSFEYNIVYQPGKENLVADTLSCKEGSPTWWTVYDEDEPQILAINGAEWHVWEKIKDVITLDE